MQCPDPGEAHERIAAAKVSSDRYSSAILRLKAKLSTVLAKEATDRFWSDYFKVRKQRDDAAKSFQRYQALSEEIAALFLTAEQVDREVSRVDGSAPDGEHRRLRPVELHARNNGFQQRSTLAGLDRRTTRLE